MIRVQPSAYLMAAALVLLLPLDWLFAAVLAAAFHELGHLAAIHAVGGHPDAISIGGAGARICTEPLENREEFLCAAAGPSASLLLLSLCRLFPKLALCALVQGMFNLIPVHPMDGGRMLYCLLRRLCPGWAERIYSIVQFLIFGGILGLTLFLTVHKDAGFLPILAGITVLFRLRKIPCKSGGFAVQ